MRCHCEANEPNGLEGIEGLCKACRSEWEEWVEMENRKADALRFQKAIEARNEEVRIAAWSAWFQLMRGAA